MGSSSGEGTPAAAQPTASLSSRAAQADLQPVKIKCSVSSQVSSLNWFARRLPAPMARARARNT